MGNESKQIIMFILKAIGLYLVWLLVYEQWLFKVGLIDQIIIDNIIFLSVSFLNLIGYHTFEYAQTFGIDGSHGVFIGTPCDGLDLFMLFAGFIIIFKGKWLNKLLFITFGVITLHLINVLRVIALAVMAKVSPEILDFNHKYTFTILMYFIVFLGWVLWVRKYAK